jgi:hypothetical protein
MDDAVWGVWVPVWGFAVAAVLADESKRSWELGAVWVAGALALLAAGAAVGALAAPVLAGGVVVVWGRGAVGAFEEIINAPSISKDWAWRLDHSY